jgi:hypothetical protein
LVILEEKSYCLLMFRNKGTLPNHFVEGSIANTNNGSGITYTSISVDELFLEVRRQF